MCVEWLVALLCRCGFPVLNDEACYASELARIGGDQSQAIYNRLGGQQNVVGADHVSLRFECGTKPAGFLCGGGVTGNFADGGQQEGDFRFLHVRRGAAFATPVYNS